MRCTTVQKIEPKKRKKGLRKVTQEISSRVQDRAFRLDHQRARLERRGPVTTPRSSTLMNGQVTQFQFAAHGYSKLSIPRSPPRCRRLFPSRSSSFLLPLYPPFAAARANRT